MLDIPVKEISISFGHDLQVRFDTGWYQGRFNKTRREVPPL
jgi:hypothetical protein